MEYEVGCSCGKSLLVSEGMAGSSIPCECGRTVQVPSLSQLRSDRVVPEAASAQETREERSAPTPLRPAPFEEIIAPTPVMLRIEDGSGPAQTVPVLAALTVDSIWLQEVWRIRQVPLQSLSRIEACRDSKGLVLISGRDVSAERLELTFSSAAEGERWRREITDRQPPSITEVVEAVRTNPEGVALVGQAPELPYERLGRVTASGISRRTADRGLQLRAGIRGADAVIEVERLKYRDGGQMVRHAAGTAVRLANADDRELLRLRWYTEAVNALVKRMLLLLVVQAAVLFLVVMFCMSASKLQLATGQTPSESFLEDLLGLGIVFAWPLVTVALLGVLHWPALLRIAGLAVLAATTGRGLVILLTHLLAVISSGAAPAIHWGILVDPVDWAFIIWGAILGVQAWRLGGDAAAMLPGRIQGGSTARRVCGRGLLAATGVYALALWGFVGHYRYQASVFLLQPGVDPKREQEGLVALNQGAALANQGDLQNAERSLQRSLRIWEELTKGRRCPSVYRANLATTLNDLGWLRERQGQEDEAEKYYARAVALADELGDDPQLDKEFRETMAGARTALDTLRHSQLFKALDQKDQAASRKYEEAQVLAEKGAEAEPLFQEAIAVWEEILPQATNDDYKKATIVLLATAYLELGDLQQQLGKRSLAEGALSKSIAYGEKAVAQEPDRPLPKHNLAVARQMLENLRERALQEEITKLCAAERFADAVDLCVRGIEEQEEKVRSAKEPEAGTRRLAYRLDRFAWFLAHCPDPRVRDTKSAVSKARRATELQSDVADYWYTLALVQYRNGDWQDSLKSLEKVKDKEGEFDAMSWLLMAMNRFRLKQTQEARTSLRKAAEWMEEQQRKAEGNALLRLRLEMSRPSIEALKREAETLIEGKNAAADSVGS